MTNDATLEALPEGTPASEARPAPRLSPRLKRNLTNWLAVVVALNVAVGVAFSVATLRRDGDRYRDTGVVLARIEERLDLQHSLLEAGVLSAPADQGDATSTALLAGLRSLSEATKEDLVRLVRLGAATGSDGRIADEVRGHLHLVSDEVDRVEAEDTTMGDPSAIIESSERVEAQLSMEHSRVDDQARDAYRTADVESILMMGLAALMAVLLHKKFVLARRSAEERALRERAQGEERFRSLVQNANDVILICDPATTIKYQTPSAKAVLGFENNDLLGTPLIDLVHPHDARRLLAFFSDVERNAGSARTSEWRMRHLDGSWMHIEAAASNLIDDPTVMGLVFTLRDVSAQKSLEQQLRHQAFHDSLTGLANRALFSDRVGHALTRSDRSNNFTTALFVDVDDFKTVNDSLGHAAGDQLLIEVARRLEKSVRPSDTVARLGGDEFGILLEDVADEGDAQMVVDRIMTELKATVPISGRELFVRVSIGIANSGDVEEGAEELLRNADAAMYMAKGAGKGTSVTYEPTMHAAALDRLESRAALERAVDGGEFRLHYQPIVDLDTGAVRGVEALVRWQRGATLVPPAEFIPLAEETGLIHRLGDWVLSEACRNAKKWQDLYPIDPPLTMNVNISARQVLQPSLVEGVRKALLESGLDPKTLTLEITETDLILENKDVVSRLGELKELGILLAIDDFGTGYSSLSYLGQFPVDVLKIDRSFMARLADEKDPALMEAIIQLGRTLNLEVVAEGIEDSTQLDALRGLKCKRGQGFYFARPLEEDAIKELIERESLQTAIESVQSNEA